MAKALGLTPEEEHRNGIHKLAQVRPRYSYFVHKHLTKSSSK